MWYKILFSNSDIAYGKHSKLVDILVDILQTPFAPKNIGYYHEKDTNNYYLEVEDVDFFSKIIQDYSAAMCSKPQVFLISLLKYPS